MHQMSTDGKVTLIGSLLVKEGKAPFRASGVQDIVYLKNGSIIKGNVVNLIPDSTVKILTADSSVFICRMAEVERITKDSTHGLSSFSLRAQGPPRVSSPPPFKFSLRAGVAAPTGNFAATDSTGGAAQTGFLLGGNLRLAVDLTLDWMTDVTMSFNSVNVQAVSVPAGFTADFGSWFSIWALTDIRTKMPVSPNVSFFGTGQLGFLFGNSPELTLSGNGGRATVASASATSFAYGLGGGVLIENKFTVGVRFVHSEPEYTLHASGTGGTVSAKAKQSTSMMQVTAGIDF
ncbi:MAG: hypothetical protein HYR76_05940 [Ignavibacteria bacterium]|nr:hypothetical protein [Ignavibacteria bacterium]